MAFQIQVPTSSGRSYVIIALTLTITILSCWRILSDEDRTEHRGLTTATRLANLAHEDIGESSGLAISWSKPQCFWTHNDSGDEPRIFAFDDRGTHLGCCKVEGAKAIDWEGMSSFQRDGKNWLLIGDVGDNGRRRKTSQLYLLEEPDVTSSTAVAERIDFQYEDGPHNCESIAVDAENNVALLVTKVIGFSCQLFELQLPKLPCREVMTARLIGKVPATVTVDMDISPDGSQAIVLTYTDAFLFNRDPDETWRQAFARAPRRVKMPSRVQGETICFGSDSRTVYLTSEKRPTPLWEVRLSAE